MESHFRLWIKENEVYIAGAMAHIRCVFKMQDSEYEAIILLQLEDYKYRSAHILYNRSAGKMFINILHIIQKSKLIYVLFMTSI